MRMHFAVPMSDGATFMDLRFVVNLLDDAADPYDPAAGDDLSDESLGLEEQFIDFVHAAGATHEEFGESAWAVSPDAAVAQPTQRYDALSVVGPAYRAEALNDPFRRVATRSIGYDQYGTTGDAIAARIPLLMGLNNITVTMIERVPQAVSARSDGRTH
eukprot:gene31495-39622_t